MIVEGTTVPTAQFMPVIQFATSLAKTGVRVFHGGSGTFWARSDFGGMMRLPRHHLSPPTSDELQQVLWHGPATVASYLLEPDEHHPANTWLYLCTDHGYTLDKLSGATPVGQSVDALGSEHNVAASTRGPASEESQRPTGQHPGRYT
jgi:hypothetical protein